MARLSKARQSEALGGAARRGEARKGKARHGEEMQAGEEMHRAPPPVQHNMSRHDTTQYDTM